MKREGATATRGRGQHQQEGKGAAAMRRGEEVAVAMQRREGSSVRETHLVAFEARVGLGHKKSCLE